MTFSILTILLTAISWAKKNWIILLIIISIALACAGVFVYQKNKIFRLEKEKTEIQNNYLAIKSQQDKQKSDHKFDFIPEKKDIKEDLNKSETKYLKDNHLKVKDVQSHAKIQYKLDTVYLPKYIESTSTQEDGFPINHKIDFSNTNITSIITFKSLNDSVFDSKQKLIIADSLRYTQYKSKEKIGTKRFLFFFKCPKYQEVTRVIVTNSNPEIKLKDVEIVVSK